MPLIMLTNDWSTTQQVALELRSVHGTLLYVPMEWGTFNEVKSTFRLHIHICLRSLSDFLLYRYANMDYLLFSGLKKSNVSRICISYDIMCQWSKRLAIRQKMFPKEIRLPPYTTLSFGIPKFHLEGHGPACRTRFSFNFLAGSGRTCGESVETEWSVINIVASSTREMSPSARHETLNDHWGYWNWRKTTSFGVFLCFSDLKVNSAELVVIQENPFSDSCALPRKLTRYKTTSFTSLPLRLAPHL